MARCCCATTSTPARCPASSCADRSPKRPSNARDFARSARSDVIQFLPLSRERVLSATPEAGGGLRPAPENRRAMKFGVFYEIQIPRPWHERSEYDAYQQVLAQ